MKIPLAPIGLYTHIPVMKTRTEATSSKRSNPARKVLGRSAATGRFVMKPASKPGSISIREATAAATHLSNAKKK